MLSDMPVLPVQDWSGALYLEDHDQTFILQVRTV